MKGGNINYKNKGDAIYVGSFLTVHNPLFWRNGGHPGIFITVRHALLNGVIPCAIYF